MELKNIKDFFNNIEDFNEILQMIPVRKLTRQSDKDFVKKMKKYVKEYGEDMTILESQYKRILMLKDDIN